MINFLGVKKAWCCFFRPYQLRDTEVFTDEMT